MHQPVLWKTLSPESMNTRLSLAAIAVAFCGMDVASAFDKSLFDRTLPLPTEIKTAKGDIRETRKFLIAYNAEAEIKKLYGPCQVIPGEVVFFRYTWPVPAVAKDDPAKTVNQDYLKQNVFRFVAGDGNSTAELQLPSSPKTIVLSRPTNPAAPAGALIALSPQRNVVGFSKLMVQNRFCTPAKVEQTPDGKEAWWFFNAVTEKARTFKTSTSTVTGFIGNDVVSLNGTDQTPVMLSRSFVGWNFKLIFDDKGFVERLEQGSIGAGEWQQSGVP